MLFSLWGFSLWQCEADSIEKKSVGSSYFSCQLGHPGSVPRKSFFIKACPNFSFWRLWYGWYNTVSFYLYLTFEWKHLCMWRYMKSIMWTTLSTGFIYFVLGLSGDINIYMFLLTKYLVTKCWVNIKLILTCMIDFLFEITFFLKNWRWTDEL